MDEKTRQTLTEPFDPKFIRTRRGPKGKTISYLAVSDFIDRLNAAFNGDWGFEIGSREQKDNEILVEVKLTAGGVTKMAIGSADQHVDNETGEVGSYGDALKAAESDGLKRCCRLLGIGRELWNEDAAKASPTATTARKAPLHVVPGDAQQNERDRISNAQLGLLRRLAQEGGLDRDSLKALSIERFGVTVEYLGKKPASALIDELKSRGANTQAAGGPR